MTFIVVAIFIAALGVVFYGSLVPGPYRPRSGLDGHIEHGLAYAVFGASLLPFLSGPSQVLVAGISMLGLAGVLELAQRWIPGRSCRLTHFLASAAGVFLPITAGLVFMLVVG